MIPDKSEAAIAADFLEEHRMFPEVVAFLRSLPVDTGCYARWMKVLIDSNGDEARAINAAQVIVQIVERENARLGDLLGTDISSPRPTPPRAGNQANAETMRQTMLGMLNTYREEQS